MSSTLLKYQSEQQISAKYHAHKNRRTYWCVAGLLGVVISYTALYHLKSAPGFMFDHAQTAIKLVAAALAPVTLASFSGLLSVRWAETPWTQELDGKQYLQIEQWMEIHPDVDQYIKNVQSNHRNLCMYDYQMTARFTYTPKARAEAKQHAQQAVHRMQLNSEVN